MKFGVSFLPDEPVEALVKHAVTSERYGYHGLWIADHYSLRDVYTIQSVVALKTNRIALGTAVTNPFLRHPSVTASAIATLDEISEGRAILGLGGGGHETFRDLQGGSKGYKSYSGSVEAIRVIRALLSGQKITNKGSIFPTNDAKLKYQPRRKIPIYLACRGPKMLNLAGEMCDGVMAHGTTQKFWEYVRREVEKGLRIGGRRISQFETVLHTRIALTDDLDKTYQTLRAASLGVIGGDYPDEILPYYNLKSEEIHPIRDALKKGVFNKGLSLITEKMIDSFCVVGNSEECLKKLNNLKKVGVQYVIDNTIVEGRNQHIEAIGKTIVKNLGGGKVT